MKNPKITIDSDFIIINTFPINPNLNSDYIFLGIAFLLSIVPNTINNNTKYFIALIAIILIWKDFESVKKTKIDLLKREIVVQSKNIFIRIFKNISEIKFSNIDSYKIYEKGGYGYYKRFKLLLILKNGDTIILTDFSEQIDAYTIVEILNNTLKK